MNPIFVIVQQEHLTTGHGESKIVDVLATQSVYGGHHLPSFSSRKQAEAYLAQRDDRKWRGLRVISIDLM